MDMDIHGYIQVWISDLGHAVDASTDVWYQCLIIINKVLIKVTLNKVIAGALYLVICGWNAVKVLGWQLTVEWQLKQRCL